MEEGRAQQAAAVALIIERAAAERRRGGDLESASARIDDAKVNEALESAKVLLREAGGVESILALRHEMMALLPTYAMVAPVLLNGSITDTNFAASLAEDVKQLWRIACNGVKDENARSIMFKLLYRLIATLPEARRLILQDGSALEVLLGSVSNSAEGRVTAELLRLISLFPLTKKDVNIIALLNSTLRLEGNDIIRIEAIKTLALLPDAFVAMYVHKLDESLVTTHLCIAEKFADIPAHILVIFCVLHRMLELSIDSSLKESIKAQLFPRGSSVTEVPAFTEKVLGKLLVDYSRPNNGCCRRFPVAAI